jgi:hypothetical protein
MIKYSGKKNRFLFMSFCYFSIKFDPFTIGNSFAAPLPSYGDESAAYEAAKKGDYTLFEANKERLRFDPKVDLVIKIRKLFEQLVAYKILATVTNNEEKKHKYSILSREYYHYITGLFYGFKERPLTTKFKEIGFDIKIRNPYITEDKLRAKIYENLSPSEYYTYHEKSFLTKDIPYPYLDENRAYTEAELYGNYALFEENIEAWKKEKDVHVIIKQRKMLLQYRAYSTLAASKGDNEKVLEYFMKARSLLYSLLMISGSMHTLSVTDSLKNNELIFLFDLGCKIKRRLPPYDLACQEATLRAIFHPLDKRELRLILSAMDVPTPRSQRRCTFSKADIQQEYDPQDTPLEIKRAIETKTG